MEDFFQQSAERAKMSFISGTVSFVRYRVEGDIPADFWNFAAERISAHAFRDIDDSFEEVSIGWVSLANMFDSGFTEASYVAGDYLAMALRMDERKVAPAALKKFCLKEEQRLLKERQVPKLSRSQKLDIKENMRIKLLKQAVPVPAVYEMCWSLADNSITFFSTSGKAQTLFEELFRNTFDLGAILDIPYTLAISLLPEATAAIETLSPAVIA